MSSYEERTADFFVQSVLYLKKRSGGQRWNSICEDTVEIFFDRFPNGINNPFTRDSLWSSLFDPTDELRLTLASLCKQEPIPEFLFLILQSLLDPPTHWWKDSSIPPTK